MKIDSQKIIADTHHSFTTSSAQQRKFNDLDFIDETDYKLIHKNFLTPTSITINIDKFLDDISNYSQHFYQWGNNHSELPRYGLALVNQDGILKSNDPINGSLHEWNKNFPDDPIIETDCCILTEVMQIESLQPLKVFDGHWCRSNVLKWNSGAHFKPHIDTVLPSPWLRFWGTTNTAMFDINYDNGSGQLTKFTNIEAGRIYVIDTSMVHDAVSHADNVYQFFLSVKPSAINILKEHICPA